MAEVDTTKRIHVTRNIGTPYRATTLKGYTVERHDKLIGPNNSVVLCTEYDDHFVYRNPHVIYDNAIEPMFLCTCGAIAIQVWGDQVPSSHQNKMVCSYDALTDWHGFHATRQVNKEGFENQTGKQKLNK